MRLIAIFLFLCSTAMAQQTVLEWEFLHPLTKKWFPFGTKGSVQEALIASGELPDPFIGLNEEKFAWIEDHNWEFRSEVILTDAQLAAPQMDLELPNVDTYAKVYFNEEYLGTTDNTYLTFRYAIRKYAKPGKNQIRLIFQSPVNYQKTRLKSLPVTLPAPNDLGKIAVAPHCRKPQYQFGWDWSMRITTIGMWNPAKIITYGSNRVTGKGIYTATLAEDFALMDMHVSLRNPISDTLVWNSQLFGTIRVVADKGIIRRLERMEQPRLWWPRGQGEQYLYEDEWTIMTLSGEIIGKEHQRFGVRRSELINVPDKWGTSYTIRVNGRDMFCKGGNYIPQDIFPSRVTDKALQDVVETMAATNFNMVRVWGGGYYQPEAFYNACDELGIMVWQDFMFACAMYPGTDEFLQNVKREFDQEIPRLSTHPSVVLFNGNNEVDVAWKNWGFQKQYSISSKQSEIIQTYYDKLFKQLLPESVKQWTNTPYIHTSPLSNWGKDEYFNHGTMHYWGVWHGKDPIEDFGRKTGRFNSEYGFQSFPEYATLLTFSDTTQWKLDSPVMKHHQKSYVGNGMIEKHANILYGKTADFRRFVYYSQLTQATAVSMAISGHRTNMPRCSGTIYWQVNDCWPAPTWSSIDYFGNWKALQYVAREDYQDVAILAKTDTIGKEKFHLVSDQPHGFGCKITAELFDLSGKQLEVFTCNQAVLGWHNAELFPAELAAYKSSDYVIRFHWNNAAGVKQERSFTHISSARTPAAREAISWKLTQIDTLNKTAVIEVENTSFIRNLWIYSTQNGIRFENNFIDLLPGKHTISIRFQDLPQAVDFDCIWM